jgi:hypothetical protein
MAIGISATIASHVHGQLNIFKKAQPREESFELAQNNGPWLIMCASFVGERGEVQAQKLVEELRGSYKLEAYIYRHTFDHSDTIHAIGWEPPKNNDIVPVPKQLKAAHADSFEEIAVVVGDFPSLEDNNAQRTLGIIKALQPQALTINEHTSTNQRMGALRVIQRNMSSDPKAREKGPMGSAFLMPNPLLPEEYFQTPVIDKVIIKLNKGARYSLLDCPGNYSVKVATFKGDVTFRESEIIQKQEEYQRQLKSGKPLAESKLAEAAVKAELMCLALRKMGIEAWQFHDYHESYVCVGSFDWAKRMTAGGEETNSDIAEVIQKFKAQEVFEFGQKKMRTRTINVLSNVDINFDAQPLPIVVPKAPVSTGRRLFGR